jgi:hypothetical protein
MKIKTKDGSVIDLEDIRKEQVFIGNPYAVDNAILIKHNIALLDALEAALNITDMEPQPSKRASERQEAWASGFKGATHAVRSAIGLIEENPVAD